MIKHFMAFWRSLTGGEADAEASEETRAGLPVDDVDRATFSRPKPEAPTEPGV